MKSIPHARAAVVAVLLGTSLMVRTAPVEGQSTPPTPESAQEALVRTLDARTSGDLTVDRDPTTGAVTFVGTEPGRPLSSPTEAAATPETASGAFVQEFGTLFGAASAAELERQESVPTPESGGASVMYQQTVGDVPVMAGELRIQVDGTGDVLSAIGELQPGAASVDTTPTITVDDATTEALTNVSKAYNGDAASFTATNPELVIYAPDLMGGAAFGPPRLVWQLTVSGGGAEGPVDELTLIDAHTGAVPLHFNQVAEAKNRRVCDGAGIAQTRPAVCTTTNAVRVEGSDPIGNVPVDNAYLLTGAAYDFFKTRVGRDSVDGDGLTLSSIVRYCDTYYGCPLNNAFWSNDTMHFGQGWTAADDITTHELSHGIVEYTAGLYYYFQSGAINEHLADVFGELMDQSSTIGTDTAASRWLIGEDTPNGAFRNMKNPGAFNHPDSMTSANYHQSIADEGGVHINSGVGNKAAYLVTAGDTFNSQTVRGLGIPKTTRIYYRALTTMLGSASDYRDLAQALPQACTNVIGVDGITASDCDQVSRAVTAVSMATEAPNSIGGPVAACQSGTVPSPVYQDDFEGVVNWEVPSTDPTRIWVLGGTGAVPPYATSGTHSLYVRDFDVTVTAAARTHSTIHLPANPSVLTFNQSFGLEPGFDFGTVELSEDGGASWFDLGPWMTNGGYNRFVNAQHVYSGWSGGYATTRVDLSPYANKDILLQFVLHTDRSAGSEAWWVDDVAIQSCSAGSTRPDALIRVGTGTFIGDNSYTNGSASQTRTATVPAGGTANFVVKLQQDDTVTEPFVISGPESTNQFVITYLQGSTDITSQVVAGTYQTPPIAPGTNFKIKVTIKARSSAPVGASFSAKVRATSPSNALRKDAVQAVVTRN